MNIRILAAAFSLFGNPALTAEPEAKPESELESKSQELTTEPVLCYRLLMRTGLEITVGQSVEVCAATRDAAATVACFAEAWAHPAEGGLGLTRGQAVDLCRTIPREGV